MKWESAPLKGVEVFTPTVLQDARGWFAKGFHADWYAERGLDFTLREEFCTLSQPGVLRGMHFQATPHAHAKLVSCLAGRVLDVIVDLRRASAMRGQAWAVELSAQNHKVVHVPVGCAHGFCVLGDEAALVHYLVTSVHVPEHDMGIRWDSFGFSWPVSAPVLSPRDAALPTLAEFNSPF